MTANNYLFDFNATRQPYNAILTLPLNLLQQVTPFILDEIMLGLVHSEGTDKVVLQLSIATNKAAELKNKSTLR